MDGLFLRQLLALAGSFYWPLELRWDFMAFRLGETRGSRPLILHPGQEFKFVTEKDVPVRAGYVWGGYVAANRPLAGFRIKYRGLQREFAYEPTFQYMFDLGLAQASPGMFTLSRFNYATPPEYVAVATPSLFFPFGRNFEVTLLNKDTANAIFYDAAIMLMLLYD